ncbi:hypothetical protein [Alkalihalophilus marmarensis]|uniref:hypothetical protein n=1 Tax=Alkalihalophilus marmarensis TaxID=521377 RepID=UPI002DBA1829|nr:hypothetical protein [Alkalihalophilus marmarensis]MEC2073754.1 hypothetical protein [Alkalihalophilus marmarensis]
MEFSLECIRKELETYPRIVDVKRWLYNLKESGDGFYQKNIFCIDPNDYFDLYFYVAPGEQSSINAFPIPTSILIESDLPYSVLMKKYFFRYYQRDLKDEQVPYYFIKEAHVGKEYTWFFQ